VKQELVQRLLLNSSVASLSTDSFFFIFSLRTFRKRRSLVCVNEFVNRENELNLNLLPVYSNVQLCRLNKRGVIVTKKSLASRFTNIV